MKEMPGRIKERTAFITGCSSGFGLLTAVALAQEGYHVIATMRDLSRRGRLDKHAAEGGVAHMLEVIQMDVTKPGEVNAAVSWAVERCGKIDLLVNNAGFATGGFAEEVELDEWREQFEVNVFGLIAVTRAVLPHMRAQESGTIINISSISGRFGFPGLAPYAASKHAVEGFSESLRLEMLPYGIHVVLIEPGSYRTAIWEKGLQKSASPASSPYAAQQRALTARVEQIASSAPAPDEVVRTIIRAATSPRPALRYPVGRGVRFSLLMKQWLPWRWLESIVIQKMRPPRS